MSNQVTIHCVAIKSPNGTIFRGKKWDGSPRRYFQHAHLAEELNDRIAKNEDNREEMENAVTNGIRGFLDSSGRFLDRQSASIVAKAAGQLEEGVNVPYNMQSNHILWVP